MRGMIKCVDCATLQVALGQLKSLTAANERAGKRTLIFCEDRLSLAAERTVCAAVGGTFSTSVYTFSRFLAGECGKPGNVLSAQGSAMAVRRIIEEHKNELTLFRQLSAPGAAQAVYDTIALLYSSRVSAEDVKAAAAAGGLLGGKLKDLSVIYAAYTEYLAANGLQDRNGYLKRLAPVIEGSGRVKGAAVVFLGYQAFTCTITECVRAAFASASDVTGLFIGGKEDIYVNEAGPAFVAAAEEFGGAEVAFERGDPLPEADILRRALFDPESFYGAKTNTDKVYIFEADDPVSEYEFIAASIKKHVLDEGVRYSKISVMLPNLAENESALARVFSRYRIPYYADRRIPLIEHPLCAFIFSYLGCVISGCRAQDADGVVSSPFFPAARRDKDIFRNYALRFCSYRGGVLKPPKPGLEKEGWDIEAVERVRELFVSGYSLIKKGSGRDIFAGLRTLFERFGTEKKLRDVSEAFKTERPVQAAFWERAMQGTLQVLAEAEELCAGMTASDIVKILKSGFTAMEISLIPPKADAVFVGDIAATANTGTDIVFAANLSGDVPSSGADTALLTDREIERLGQLDLDISPKIRQVNLRTRETTGLNVCAFRKRLYLSYSSGGDNTGRSEMIAYACAVFNTKSGAELKPFDIKRLERKGTALPYYASEKLPAIKQLLKLKSKPSAFSAVYGALSENGCGAEADAALKKPAKHGISCAEQLYGRDGLSPTALEAYFTCPYEAFMTRGLRLAEREEPSTRNLDTGNFIHEILQSLAIELRDGKITTDGALTKRAAELADEKLKTPPYSALPDSKSGEYTVAALRDETVKVAAGMYEQIKNSGFTVSYPERVCRVTLSHGITISGRIDRVDECGDMVRIIDYKTGGVDSSPAKYYSGAKLQLPLYLLAASEGKRAVGAYYFPASVTYRDKDNGVFRLQGFMDGSEEVVRASDVTVQPKKKSQYVEAYLGGGYGADSVMEREQFAYFLSYARLVAGKGAEEMYSGNTSPSPAAGVCDYCRLGGSCGFALRRDGEARNVSGVSCAKIAAIAQKEAEKNG